MIRKILSLVFVFVSLLVQSQVMTASEPAMADKFRDDGKIYVVIAVIGIIFLSLLVFLVYIERKLKKVEDKVNAIKN